MIPVAALEGIHTGRPAAVLGGGPSLRADFPRLPDHAVRLSVNQHGTRYGRCEFLVYLDSPNLHPSMLRLMLEFPGLRVGRDHWSQVDLSGAAWWQELFSSQLAAWLACFMGCEPVLLAGMDCYQGDQMYDDPDCENFNPTNAAYTLPLDMHLASWRKAFQKCPHPERIRAMSGPLASVFGDWQTKS